MTNRLVTFTVSRNNVELYTVTGRTDSTGRVPVLLPTGKTTPPAGELAVRAEISLSTGGTSSASVTTTVANWTITPGPTPPGFLSALMGAAYPLATPLTATIADAYGNAGPGVPVTFTFPSTGPFATFPPPSGNAATRVRTVSTGLAGVATAPRATAGTIPGSFQATITAPGATTATSIPLAAQYGLGAFVSPVASSTTTGSTGTTPVKIAVLGPTGAKLSDADAAALLAAQRIQIRWRKTGTTLWTASTAAITYNASKDFFQSDLKASSMVWTKPNTYQVEFRVLPVTGAPQPQPSTPAAVLQGTFDLGSRSFTITVTK